MPRAAATTKHQVLNAATGPSALVSGHARSEAAGIEVAHATFIPSGAHT